MIGNHAIPVIVDAYLKGFRGFDIEEAYKAVKETSMTNHKNSDWNIYNKYGYYPFDLINVESVSRTLEVSYDDYCVGVMAQALGKETDADFFGRRSLNYRNLFDSETKLMRGKALRENGVLRLTRSFCPMQVPLVENIQKEMLGNIPGMFSTMWKN